MTPAERLERTQWDLFWLPPDASVVDRPDLLQVSCPRPAGYLNMVIRARCAPGDALALVDEASARAPLRWQVADTFDRAPLAAALAARGWSSVASHEARLLAVDAWRREPPLTVRPVDSRASLIDAITVGDRAFDRSEPWTEESLAADLHRCTAPGTRVHRFVAYDDRGAPVASGGLNSFPALQIGLLWAGGTVPEARGQGAYLSLLAARVERARALGLRWVGLYARTSSSAPIVARLGFERHGEMHYWERPPAPTRSVGVPR